MYFAMHEKHSVDTEKAQWEIRGKIISKQNFTKLVYFINFFQIQIIVLLYKFTIIFPKSLLPSDLPYYSSFLTAFCNKSNDLFLFKITSKVEKDKNIYLLMIYIRGHFYIT